MYVRVLWARKRIGAHTTSRNIQLDDYKALGRALAVALATGRFLVFLVCPSQMPQGELQKAPQDERQGLGVRLEERQRLAEEKCARECEPVAAARECGGACARLACASASCSCQLVYWAM